MGSVRFALPSVNRRTLETTNLYESMVPLIPSFGVLIEFSEQVAELTGRGWRRTGPPRQARSPGP
jgi:hypothetical protein